MSIPIFIGRQPIIDRDKSIFGYEILFRTSVENNSSGVSVCDNLSATASVLENIYDMGIKTLMGDKPAFINVTPDVLKKDMMEILPKDKIVLEILETSKIDDNVISIVREFKNKGFRIALDDFVYTEEWEPLLPLSNYVKLDVKQYSRTEIKEMFSILKSFDVKLLAEKIETDEDFQFYKDVGFDLFQGYFFQKPVVITSKTLDLDYKMLLNIFNSFQANADIEEIELLFKMSPDLIYRLLKLVNSVAYDFMSKISSVKQAITLLGYDNISRWILTIVLASKKSDSMSDPVLESAMIRGRMMEDICKKYIHKGLSDKAFLTGMLSLVNIALGMSLKELLDEIRVDSIIKEALVAKKGKLGELNAFIDEYDKRDYFLADSILKKINPSISFSDIIKINTDALMYLEEVKKTGLI